MVCVVWALHCSSHYTLARPGPDVRGETVSGSQEAAVTAGGGPAIRVGLVMISSSMCLVVLVAILGRLG